MGNWHIAIEGVGAHHNADYPKDANLMVERFVRELVEAGHTVESATFTHGARDDIRKKVHDAMWAAKEARDG